MGGGGDTGRLAPCRFRGGLEFADDESVFANEKSGEGGAGVEGHIGEGGVIGGAVVDVFADKSYGAIAEEELSTAGVGAAEAAGLVNEVIGAPVDAVVAESDGGHSGGFDISAGGLVADGGTEAECCGSTDGDGAIFPCSFTDKQSVAGAIGDIAHVDFGVAESDPHGRACGSGAVGRVGGWGGADAGSGDHDIVGCGDGNLSAAVGDVHVIPVGSGGGADVVIEGWPGVGWAAVHGHGGLEDFESCGVGSVDLERSDADVEGLVDIGLFELWEDEGAPGVDANFGGCVAVSEG